MTPLTTYEPPETFPAMLPPRDEPVRDGRLRQLAALLCAIEAFRADAMTWPADERMVA